MSITRLLWRGKAPTPVGDAQVELYLHQYGELSPITFHLSAQITVCELEVANDSVTLDPWRIGHEAAAKLRKANESIQKSTQEKQ
jgi:hypothetical protein